jgi:hypothetical protein
MLIALLQMTRRRFSGRMMRSRPGPRILEILEKMMLAPDSLKGTPPAVCPPPLSRRKNSSGIHHKSGLSIHHEPSPL